MKTLSNKQRKHAKKGVSEAEAQRVHHYPGVHRFAASRRTPGGEPLRSLLDIAVEYLISDHGATDVVDAVARYMKRIAAKEGAFSPEQTYRAAIFFAAVQLSRDFTGYSQFAVQTRQRRKL